MKDGKDVIAQLRNQIKSPMNLREIIEEYRKADYSAEMLLQHLLLWVANNQPKQPMNTQELIDAIRQWGIDKGITGPSGKGTLLGQLSKTQEELTETRDAAVLHHAGLDEMENKRGEIVPTKDELEDGLGDTFITLVLAAEMAGTTIEACAARAYGVISKRTGRMENGQFVKDAE